MTRVGLFITMEGLDGCGKSTQLERLAAALGERGHDVMVTREPGGTPLGEGVRGLLTSAVSDGIVPTAELMLIVGARAQHVAQVIRPALAAGRVVISDRYTDSSVAFQGYGRGLDLGLIERVNLAATEGLRPALTILLDLEPEAAQARMSARPVGGLLGALDVEKLDFHARVRRGYLELAAAEADRVRVVQAAGSSDETHAAVMQVVLQRVTSDE
ncbi:MAG TPA: dTMP kinase [Blastocatellia bacterium]|nr:dTMP kinase [Blastocatellia bacterium]